jgi:hypothetical protein
MHAPTCQWAYDEERRSLTIFYKNKRTDGFGKSRQYSNPKIRARDFFFFFPSWLFMTFLIFVTRWQLFSWRDSRALACIPRV